MLETSNIFHKFALEILNSCEIFCESLSLFRFFQLDFSFLLQAISNYQCIQYIVQKLINESDKSNLIYLKFINRMGNNSEKGPSSLIVEQSRHSNNSNVLKNSKYFSEEKQYKRNSLSKHGSE